MGSKVELSFAGLFDVTELKPAQAAVHSKCSIGWFGLSPAFLCTLFEWQLPV